jgi:hypothetical protein
MFTSVSGQLTLAAAVPIVLGSVLAQFPNPINQNIGIYLVNGIGVIGAIVGPLLVNWGKMSIKTIFVVGWALMSLSLVMVVIFQLAAVAIMTVISLSML